MTWRPSGIGEVIWQEVEIGFPAIAPREDCVLTMTLELEDDDDDSWLP